MNELIAEAKQRMIAATPSAMFTTPCSSPLAIRNGYESRYSLAYKELVKLGAAPKLRTRYR